MARNRKGVEENARAAAGMAMDACAPPRGAERARSEKVRRDRDMLAFSQFEDDRAGQDRVLMALALVKLSIRGE